MALAFTSEEELGFVAPDFFLTNVVTNKKQSFKQLKGEKATVVVFMCNHCPYVIHVLDKLIEIAANYKEKGVSFIAISSNDVTNYPDDKPEKMKELAIQKDFTFPYLYDETQKVAKQYNAECTPDFSVFDSNNLCVYRGRFDDSTPGNDNLVTGNDLKAVIDNLIQNKPIPNEQFPSCGCSIKWKN